MLVRFKAWWAWRGRRPLWHAYEGRMGGGDQYTAAMKAWKAAAPGAVRRRERQERMWAETTRGRWR